MSQSGLTDHRDYRNYRGVFGRARDERVLQFPSYSFDVSVMNIWDTFAVGRNLPSAQEAPSSR